MPSTLIFETGPLTGLELTNTEPLAGQGTTGDYPVSISRVEIARVLRHV